jgi:hypothetical protein
MTFYFGLRFAGNQITLKEGVPYSKVNLAASSKLPFTLVATIDAVSENSSK